MRRRRLALLAAAALVAGGCGSERSAPTAERPPLTTRTVLSGAQTTTILRPRDVPPGRRLPVVLFLHGWGATEPRHYGPWLEHLVAQGNVVVFPRYQDTFLYPPRRVLGNVVTGFRAALASLGDSVDPSTLVVAGHSAGGALSADYAALAPSARLPRPRAVFVMYPGRFLEGWPSRIPPVDPGRIPARTRVVVLVGERDTVVPASVGEAIAEGADRVPRDRRTLVPITDDAVDEHNAPLRDSAEAQQTFWRRLDDLIASVR